MLILIMTMKNIWTYRVNKEERKIGDFEIDIIQVEFGLESFVKLALDMIERECSVWDLSRIGVEDF